MKEGKRLGGLGEGGVHYLLLHLEWDIVLKFCDRATGLREEMELGYWQRILGEGEMAKQEFKMGWYDGCLFYVTVCGERGLACCSEASKH